MSEPFPFAVLLIVETSDPRLSAERLAETADSPANTAQVRRAVLQHLPKDVRRVAAVMPIEHAKALILLHEAVGHEITGASSIVPRHPDYVAPSTE